MLPLMLTYSDAGSNTDGAANAARLFYMGPYLMLMLLLLLLPLQLAASLVRLMVYRKR